jgi:hypothetical protein
MARRLIELENHCSRFRLCLTVVMKNFAGLSRLIDIALESAWYRPPSYHGCEESLVKGGNEGGCNTYGRSCLAGMKI